MSNAPVLNNNPKGAYLRPENEQVLNRLELEQRQQMTDELKHEFDRIKDKDSLIERTKQGRLS